MRSSTYTRRLHTTRYAQRGQLPRRDEPAVPICLSVSVRKPPGERLSSKIGSIEVVKTTEQAGARTLLHVAPNNRNHGFRKDEV